MRKKIRHDIALNEFKLETFKMLVVLGKNETGASKMINDNQDKIEAWLDDNNRPIITAQMCARLLLREERSNFDINS